MCVEPYYINHHFIISTHSTDNSYPAVNLNPQWHTNHFYELLHKLPLIQVSIYQNVASMPG